MSTVLSTPGRKGISAKSNTSSFGTQPTDHMFLAEYSDGKWHSSGVVPFTNLALSPLAMCLHYGQTVFEGMKAFANSNGGVSLFRPGRHYERFDRSLQRMCMPSVSEKMFMQAINSVVLEDAGWIPKEKGGALYIRPFMIATEERIGLKVSDKYLFLVVCSPVAAYYTNPLKVKIETSYIRSADGGTGFAKCGGNYGGAFYPTMLANENGYDQVLWTDSKNHCHIEESGTMNIMFFIDGKLLTPALSGSILDGVTRDSILLLARDMGITVEERAVSCNEIQNALHNGKQVEAFGTAHRPYR